MGEPRSAMSEGRRGNICYLIAIEMPSDSQASPDSPFSDGDLIWIEDDQWDEGTAKGRGLDGRE